MSSREKRISDSAIEVPMTPMIDVVFMLLIFFLVTFEVVVPEGDFSVRMPQVPGETSDLDKTTLPIVVHLKADDQGRLTRIGYGERTLWSGTSDNPIDAQSGFNNLRARIVDTVMKDGALDPVAASETEIELACDYNLKFAFVVEAMTSVTGYTTDKGADCEIHKLVEKVRLRPQGEG